MRRLHLLATLLATTACSEDPFVVEPAVDAAPTVAVDAGTANDARPSTPDAGAPVTTADAAPSGPCGPSEPANDSSGTAPPLPAASTEGNTICSGDSDWYRIEPTQAGKLYVFGTRSILDDGDLDADLTDAAGKSLGASYINDSLYHREGSVGPTDTEVYSVIGKPGAAPLWLRVYGYNGATNRYGVVSRVLDWKDGRCQDLFSHDDCRAQTSGTLDPARLIVFPVTTADDPFIGRATFTLSGLENGQAADPASRQMARRELIMIVRGAIRAVQDAFPGTTPLGIGDIGMPDGTTPDGHPIHTHDNGANIDFAYFVDPAKQRAWGNMAYRQICCDASRLDDWSCVDLDTASAGYGTCKASASHIVDVPRTAMAIAKIAGSGRLRVIGVDTQVKPDLEAELAHLASTGKITAAERDAALARMASKDDHPSWLWHFNHMHASFCAGECSAKRAAGLPQTEGLWDEALDGQAERALQYYRP